MLLAGRHVDRRASCSAGLSDRLRDAGPGRLEVRIRSDRSVPYRFVEPIMLACARTGHLERDVRRLSAGGRSLMRRPSAYTDRRGELDVKMTPMIDVVFLLLVFFVWTASFQIVEHVLPSHLSAVVGHRTCRHDEPPPPEEDFDKVVIRVHVGQRRSRAGGSTTCRSRTCSRFAGRLEAIAGIKRDAPVILHPDPDVPLGHVIDLYDITRLVGFEKIQFAASEKI